MSLTKFFVAFTYTLASEPDDFSRYFRLLCDGAGIRRVRLHDRGYTCASMLLAQSVPPRVVMEILGAQLARRHHDDRRARDARAQRQALEGMDGLLDDG